MCVRVWYAVRLTWLYVKPKTVLKCNVFRGKAFLLSQLRALAYTLEHVLKIKENIIKNIIKNIKEYIIKIVRKI